MATFEYEALDAKGKVKKGIVNADTSRQVKEMVKSMGLYPVGIQLLSDSNEPISQNKNSANKSKIHSSSPKKAQSRARYKIKPMELSVVTRQLATLLGSGLTVEDSLKAIVRQAESHSSKAVLQQVMSNVLEGRSLAEAMGQNPKSFPGIYIASVSAGEQTGRLADVMERLADYTEQGQNLRRTITVALIYPALLTVVSIGILVALLTYVVPKVVTVFADTGQTLPVMTQVLIAISDFLQQYGLYILVAIIAVCVFFYKYYQNEDARYRLHKKFLKIAGIKRLSKGLNSARMARTLSIMVGSGVPLLASLKASENVITNLVMKKSLNKATEEVSEGSSLGNALERTGVFPAMLVQMVHSGEASGRLAPMLEKAASSTENELEARVSALVGLFEPMMIIIMGGLVFMIVMAILLPIFELNEIVG